jgi:hypothetical protein
MTVQEAIAEVNKLKQNTIDDGTKVMWLSRLDSLVYTEIIKAHRLNAATVILPQVKETFTPYDENNAAEEVLLAPYTYADMYIFWLEAQINYWNDDIENYNKAITRFTEKYNAFANWFNQNIRRDN